jgi:hypothetical protein
VREREEIGERKAKRERNIDRKRESEREGGGRGRKIEREDCMVMQDELFRYAECKRDGERGW